MYSLIGRKLTELHSLKRRLDLQCLPTQEAGSARNPKYPFSLALRRQCAQPGIRLPDRGDSRCRDWKIKNEAAEDQGGLSAQLVANRHQFPFSTPPPIFTPLINCAIDPVEGEGSRFSKGTNCDLKGRARRQWFSMGSVGLPRWGAASETLTGDGGGSRFCGRRESCHPGSAPKESR